MQFDEIIAIHMAWKEISGSVDSDKMTISRRRTLMNFIESVSIVNAKFNQYIKHYYSFSNTCIWWQSLDYIELNALCTWVLENNGAKKTTVFMNEVCTVQSMCLIIMHM